MHEKPHDITGLKPATIEQVFTALPVDGRPVSYAEVCDIVGMWAPITIKKALLHLKVQGRVIRCGPPDKALFRRADDSLTKT